MSKDNASGFIYVTQIRSQGSGEPLRQQTALLARDVSSMTQQTDGRTAVYLGNDAGEFLVEETPEEIIFRIDRAIARERAAASEARKSK